MDNIIIKLYTSSNTKQLMEWHWTCRITYHSTSTCNTPINTLAHIELTKCLIGFELSFHEAPQEQPMELYHKDT